MASRQQRPRTTVAEQGDGWRVEYDRETRDYSAIITRDDRGYIGSKATQTAARELIRETLLSAAAHS